MAETNQAGKAYTVESARPSVYLDDGGKPVNGYVVTVRFNDFDELHEVRVKTLDPKEVQKAIDKLLKQRTALADLG